MKNEVLIIFFLLNTWPQCYEVILPVCYHDVILRVCDHEVILPVCYEVILP